MRSYQLDRLTALLFASTALLGLTHTANAADIDYIGLATGGLWGTVSNWSSGTLPTATDTVIIRPGTQSITINSGQTYDVGMISVLDGSALNNNGIGGTISAGSLIIHGVNGVGFQYSSDGTGASGPRKFQLANNVTFIVDNPNGSQVTIANSGTAALNDKILTIDTVYANNVLVISGGVSGTGGIVKTGDGLVWTAVPTHSYTGTTDIQSGTMELRSAASLNSSSLINVDGVFDVSAITAASTSIQTLTGTGIVQLGTKMLNFTNASTTFAGSINGTGGITVSTGSLALSGANSYSGDTTIAVGARLQLGAGGATGSLDSQNIINHGELAFNRSDAFIVAADISGTGGLSQIGTGTTTLSGTNTYSGDTNIDAGTLKAGAANVFSTTSAFAVSSGAALDLNDTDQTLASLTNAGNVNFGTSTDTLLHITGDYTGNNGMLTINAVLGDDTSKTNKIIIDGDTSGTTLLHVNNRGGTGDATTSGIEVITVGGSSDGDFILDAQYRTGGKPVIVIGAYEYGLYKGNAQGQDTNDWYLISKKTPDDPKPEPEPEPTPTPNPNPENPNTDPEPTPEAKLQAGAPVYEAYSQHLLGMNEVSSLRQRTGNRVWAGQTASPDKAASMGNGVWGRIEGAHNRLEPNQTTTGTQTRQNIFKMQAGIDGAFLENEQGSLIGGVFGQYMHGKTRTSSRDFVSGDISTDGYGLGGTLTWYGENGFYADALTQATWYDSDLTTSAEGAAALATGSRAFGYAVSLESGQQLSINDRWSVTPQGQLVYSSVDADSFIDGFGSAVRFDRGESLQGRLGVNLDYTSSWQNAKGTTDRANLYGIANLYYEFRDGTRADLAGVSLASRQDRLWGGLGVGGTYSFDGERYSVFGEGLINTSLNNFGNSYALKGNVGFRVHW
ncbi:autotransporter family protein [Brucella haematophila]|nr:autotransporter outer membrane beta-barrel domain-containing protein [Brucella haematophila]TMV05816.1 autotransporter outer membrane beta-barrel domain-containing protein [Brucella haematophila]